MTNFEKYRDDILKLIGKGQMPAKKGDKIVACLDTPCDDCDFFDNYGGCMLDFKWLNEDDGVPSLAQLQMSDLQAAKTRLQNENEKLKEKIVNLKVKNGKLEEKIEKQKETNNRLIEEKKEKYEAGWDDGYYACWRDCEKRQNLRAGDVIRVKDYPLRELLVTEVGDHVFYGMDTKTGAIFSNSDIEDWEQTGRHIDIQEILKLIPRGEENDNR